MVPEVSNYGAVSREQARKMLDDFEAALMAYYAAASLFWRHQPATEEQTRRETASLQQLNRRCTELKDVIRAALVEGR